MNKFYLKGKIICQSPIAVCGGKDEYSDNDILLDANNIIFIPGTTIAGVCRHYLGENDDVKSLFGAHEDNNDMESRITFYESFFHGAFRKKVRDGVKIGFDGVSEPTGKFDYEVADFDFTNVKAEKINNYFDFRIEIDNYCNEDKSLVSKIINGMNNGEIRFGRKCSRGFGVVKVYDVKVKNITDINDLLKFSWDDATTWDDLTTQLGDEDKSCSVYSRKEKFDVQSFIMIGNNSTLLKKDDGNFINAETLKNASKNPVIPGTSLSGVFRHHFYKILKAAGKDECYIGEFLDRVFGNTDHSSFIVFEECVIEGSHCMCQTRNAIDRFTGGAADKKLFTNQLSYGGKIDISVLLRSGLVADDEKLAKNLIDLTFSDLEDGSLNIGAFGSVGGGILKKVGEQ